MKLIIKCFISVSCFFYMSTAQAQGKTVSIEVFMPHSNVDLIGVQDLKRKGVKVVFYNLNHANNMDYFLSHNLPSNPSQAATIVKQRLSDPKWKAKMNDLYKGRNLAASYGLPPVLDDVYYVINGTFKGISGNLLKGYVQWAKTRQSR